MQTSRKSSLVLLHVALSLLVIAGAGLLQCWCSYILKTMIDRDKICVRDIFNIWNPVFLFLPYRKIFLLQCCMAKFMLEWCWSSFYLRLRLICPGFLTQTSMKLSLGHKLVAFLLFVPDMICLWQVSSFPDHGYAQVRAKSLDMIFEVHSGILTVKFWYGTSEFLSWVLSVVCKLRLLLSWYLWCMVNRGTFRGVQMNFDADLWPWK